MAIFYEVLTLQTRLDPSEVERRLQDVTRKPRTALEVLQRVPRNPPEHPDFIGTVKNGRFKLVPLVLAPDDVGHSYVRRSTVRGSITARDDGAQVTLLVCDPVLGLMGAGMSLAAAVTALATTGGWPPWHPAHAILAVVVAASLGFCALSLNKDIANSTASIRRHVKAMEPKTERGPRR